MASAKPSGVSTQISSKVVMVCTLVMMRRGIAHCGKGGKRGFAKGVIEIARDGEIRANHVSGLHGDDGDETAELSGVGGAGRWLMTLGRGWPMPHW
jgi:hypothetical protein